jgi:hypothetical protein
MTSPINFSLSLSAIVALAHLKNRSIQYSALEHWLEDVRMCRQKKPVQFPCNLMDKVTQSSATLPVKDGIDKIRDKFSKFSSEEEKSEFLQHLEFQLVLLLDNCRAIETIKKDVRDRTRPMFEHSGRSDFDELLEILDGYSAEDRSVHWELIMPEEPKPVTEVIVCLDAHPSISTIRDRLDSFRASTRSIEIHVTSGECRDAILSRFDSKLLHVSARSYGEWLIHFLPWCMHTDKTQVHA